MSNTMRVALVTGAARRIGADIAHTLHQAGLNIVLHYNASEKEAVTLCEALNHQRAHSAVAIRAELSEVESIKSLVKEAMAIWNRLDVLVNNASLFYRTPVDQVSELTWDDLMNVNLKAAFFLSQAAAPYLAMNEGCIVNITDIHAKRSMRDYSIYCLSKNGLDFLTKILAKEWGPKIRVNAVAPGSIAWPEGENALSDEEKNKIIKHTALLRSGTPNDIAKAVLFFVQDANYVTGQIVNVDGGRTL